MSDKSYLTWHYKCFIILTADKDAIKDLISSRRSEFATSITFIKLPHSNTSLFSDNEQRLNNFKRKKWIVISFILKSTEQSFTENNEPRFGESCDTPDAGPRIPADGITAGCFESIQPKTKFDSPNCFVVLWRGNFNGDITCSHVAWGMFNTTTSKSIQT